MRKFLKVVLAATMLCTALLLSGCPEIGVMFSKQQTFIGQESMQLKSPRPDILDVIAEVGKSMGYEVTALNKQFDSISLGAQSSMLNVVLIGKISHVDLSIMSREGGRILDVQVMASGNFDTGGQEAAMKILNDFKENLSKKIGQQLEPIKSAAGGVKTSPSYQKNVPYPAGLGFEPVKPELAPPAPDVQATVPPPAAVPLPAPTPKPKPELTTVTKPMKNYLVTLKSCNIRSEANANCKIIKTVKRGEKFEKIGMAGNWFNVKLSSGETGWVFKDLVKEAE